MYIAKKQRKNKHDEVVFYFYLAESKRIDGAVKNVQKYITSIKEVDLSDTEKIKEKFSELIQKFSEEEVELLLIKIEQITA